MWRSCLVLAAVLLWCGRSSAQLGLTITVQFITDPSGLALSGSGTAAATAAFGTVQAYGGTVPTGVTKTVGASNWILSTPIDVLVQKGTLDALSTSYTLTAALQASDLTHTWKFNSLTLSTTASTITAAGVYGATVAYNFSLTVPFSTAAGAINNTINFTVTAN
jgi:hypothetical protein